MQWSESAELKITALTGRLSREVFSLDVKACNIRALLRLCDSAFHLRAAKKLKVSPHALVFTFSTDFLTT